MPPDSQPPFLVLSGIEKSFPGVRALQDGRLELRPAEVHAILGENGAGKSTLIRILAGAQPPDAGTIQLDGHPIRIASPHEGRRLGISVIYQEFNLVPAMSVRENLFLAFAYNILGIPLAAGVLYPFTGWLLSPMIAGAAMSLSSVSVIANALRLAKSPSPSTAGA